MSQDDTKKREKAFTLIKELVEELHLNFGKEVKELVLYNRLLSQTTLKHKKPVGKHLRCWTDFCAKNKNGIEKKKSKLFIQNKVEYSENVFVNFKKIFKKADASEKETLWQYLLSLSALLVTDSSAKSILTVAKKKKKKKNSSSNEEELLTNTISEIENMMGGMNFDENNPMGAVMSMMSSPALTNLVSNMKNGVDDGSLNLNKMLKAVTGLIENMTEEDGDEGGGESEEEEKKSETKEEGITVVEGEKDEEEDDVSTTSPTPPPPPPSSPKTEPDGVD